MGRQSTLIVRDPTIRSLAPTYLNPVVGWGIPLVLVGLYALGLWFITVICRIALTAGVCAVLIDEGLMWLSFYLMQQ